MIVSTTQARSKWCPLARAGQGGVNRSFEGEPQQAACCLATACMLWIEHEYEHGYCGLIRIPGNG